VPVLHQETRRVEAHILVSFLTMVIVSAIRGLSLWLWSSFGKMAPQAAEQIVEAKPAVFQAIASQLHSE
jgi:hypothetical protein